MAMKGIPNGDEFEEYEMALSTTISMTHQNNKRRGCPPGPLYVHSLDPVDPLD